MIDEFLMGYVSCLNVLHFLGMLFWYDVIFGYDIYYLGVIYALPGHDVNVVSMLYLGLPLLR